MKFWLWALILVIAVMLFAWVTREITVGEVFWDIKMRIRRKVRKIKKYGEFDLTSMVGKTTINKKHGDKLKLL